MVPFGHRRQGGGSSSSSRRPLVPESEDEAQAIHLHKILAVMFMMAAKMRHFGLEDDVSIHRVYYYLKLAENLVLRGERHVAQSFLDAAGSAGDFENEDVLAEVARMEELLRLPFDDVNGYEQRLFLHFHLQCLAEAERDNENFGAIFEHMYELYMQQPQGHVRPRGHHIHHGGEGGESEYPTDDESENDDETDGTCEGSGPEENPEESKARARLPLLHSQQFVVEKETQKAQTLTTLKPWTCCEPWKSRGRICKEPCKF